MLATTVDQLIANHGDTLAKATNINEADRTPEHFDYLLATAIGIYGPVRDLVEPLEEAQDILSAAALVDSDAEESKLIARADQHLKDFAEELRLTS